MIATGSLVFVALMISSYQQQTIINSLQQCSQCSATILQQCRNNALQQCYTNDLALIICNNVAPMLCNNVAPMLCNNIAPMLYNNVAPMLCNIVLFNILAAIASETIGRGILITIQMFIFAKRNELGARGLSNR